MVICEMCGNEIACTAKICVFCGSPQKGGSGGRYASNNRYLHKTINLELGRPQVEEALSRLQVVIADAKSRDTKVLTIIHGYGSTGKGGVIRIESRKLLDFLQARGEIREVIVGEKFNRRNTRVRELIKRFPALNDNQNLNRGNRGITLVILT